MMLESNGLSYMGFKVHVDVNKAMDGMLKERSVDSFLSGCCWWYSFSNAVGTWTAGIPSMMDFENGMEDEIAMFKATRVYKIVSVIQPPFMQWNETTRKKLILYFVPWKRIHCLEKYEGYCYDLIVEIAGILK